MIKKIIFLLINLSIIFPDDCEVLRTLFESNDVNAAYVEIMSSFMIKGKAEYADSDCNFIAFFTQKKRAGYFPLYTPIPKCYTCAQVLTVKYIY